MDIENPFEDPNFVYASHVVEVDDFTCLFEFPDGFQFYSSPDLNETALIYNEIVLKREYLPPQMKIGNDSCVFDVGANVGVFTLFIKSLYKEARVYAFEPIPETFSILQRNMALHSLPDVVVCNVAIGDEDFVERDFCYYPHMPGNSTSDPSRKEFQRSLMVQAMGEERTNWLFKSSVRTSTVRTISSIIRENDVKKIDLLKIDVEGDECAVLRGIGEDHYDVIKQMAVEVHSEDLLASVNSLLSKMGFAILEWEGLSSVVGGGNVYAMRNG